MTEKRDSEIRVYLDVLEVVWRAHPELRLGQLIVNAAGTINPFYVEDEVLLEGLEEL